MACKQEMGTTIHPETIIGNRKRVGLVFKKAESCQTRMDKKVSYGSLENAETVGVSYLVQCYNP